MPEQLREGLRGLTQALEIFGAGAMVLGFLLVSVRCVQAAFRQGGSTAVKSYRQQLGRVILIGLEILVAATIIKTVTLEPTFESTGLLASMVAIRTVLGWTMVLEMSGRWPWQRPRTDVA